MQPHREIAFSDIPALGFAVAGLVGGACALFLPVSPFWWLWILTGLVLAAFCALFFFQRKWPGTLLGLTALAAIGCFRGSTDIARGERESFVQQNSDTAIVFCRGVVVWREGVRSTARSEQLWLEGIRFEFPDTALEMSKSRVRLSVPSIRSEKIEIGDVIACNARVQSADLMQQRSVRELCWTMRERLIATARAVDDEAFVVVRGESTIRYGLYRIRETIFDVFERHLRPDSRAVAGALLLGSREAFSSGFRSDLQITGLAHLFALSGLNTGLLVSLCWLLMGWMRIPRRARYLALLSLLVFYTALGLGVPSLFRSAVMAGLLILSRMLARPSHPINLLLFAAGVELLIWPLHILDAGFHLSYLSMAGILTAYLALHKPLQDMFYSKGQSLRNRMVDTLSSTIGAQLATAPTAALLFGRIPGIAIFANVIAIPLFSLLVVLLLCLLFLDPVSSFSASAIARSIEALVGLFTGLTSSAASLIGASVSTAASVFWSASAIVFQLAAIVYAMLGRYQRAIVLSLLALNLLIWPTQLSESAKARVSVIGLPSNESIYVRVGNLSCLIGSGPDWLSERTAYQLTNELNCDGLKTLDALIVDSRLATKIGGAPMIIEVGSPTVVIDFSLPRETLTSARLDAAVLSSDAELICGETGMVWRKAEAILQVNTVETIDGATVWELNIESPDVKVVLRSMNLFEAMNSPNPVFESTAFRMTTAQRGETASWSLDGGNWSKELPTSQRLMKLWALPTRVRV